MTDSDPLVTEAIRLFDSGLTCSEAVAIAGMQRLGLESSLIPRIATAFGGGISRTQSFCGALAGGVLVLSAAYGRDQLTDDRSRVLSETQDLVYGFRERFASDNCYTLTGLDFNQAESIVIYRARVHDECRAYVRYVMECVLEAIDSDAPRGRPASA